MLGSSHLSQPQLIELAGFNDQRGNLIVGEINKQLPFSAQRFFFVSNVPEGEPRGIHAHKKCHQFLVCVAGSVKAMVDNGETRQVISLDRPNLGLHMPPMTWGAQYDYSEDAVLLVLASRVYEADDYVHEYDEFLKFVASSKMNSK